MKIYVLILLSLISFRMNAQDKTSTNEKNNPRIERPWGFGLAYFLGPNGTGTAVSYNQFIKPQIELGVEFGTLANSFFNYSASLGGKYHFRKAASSKELSLFSGLNIILLSNSIKEQLNMQVPVGILLLKQSGLKYKLSIVPITSFKNTEIYFEIGLGYNFKRK